MAGRCSNPGCGRQTRIQIQEEGNSRAEAAAPDDDDPHMLGTGNVTIINCCTMEIKHRHSLSGVYATPGFFTAFVISGTQIAVLRRVCFDYQQHSGYIGTPAKS